MMGSLNTVEATDEYPRDIKAGYLLSMKLPRGNGRKSVARQGRRAPSGSRDGPTGAPAPVGSAFCEHSAEVATGAIAGKRSSNRHCKPFAD